MYLAVSKNNIDIVKLLLKHGADVNIKDNDSNTPLHLAVSKNNIDIVNLLLKHGADVNTTDINSKTPLHRAVSNENIDIVKLLLKPEANVNIRDTYGRTPLHGASEENIDIVKLLLKHGADVNITTDYYRSTPLNLAVSKENIDIVKLLLKHGADVNTTDINSKTPLHLAVSKKNIDIVKLLIDSYIKQSLTSSQSKPNQILRSTVKIQKTTDKNKTKRSEDPHYMDINKIELLLSLDTSILKYYLQNNISVKKSIHNFISTNQTNATQPATQPAFNKIKKILKGKILNGKILNGKISKDNILKDNILKDEILLELLGFNKVDLFLWCFSKEEINSLDFRSASLLDVSSTEYSEIKNKNTANLVPPLQSPSPANSPANSPPKPSPPKPSPVKLSPAIPFEEPDPVLRDDDYNRLYTEPVPPSYEKTKSFRRHQIRGGKRRTQHKRRNRH